MIENPRPPKINKTQARIITVSLISQLEEKIDNMIKDGMGDQPLNDIIPQRIVSMGIEPLNTTIVGSNQLVNYEVMIVTGSDYFNDQVSISVGEGGIFTDLEQSSGHIFIDLNSARTPNQIKLDIDLNISQKVYSILIHEYTHAREYKDKSTYKSRLERYSKIVDQEGFKGYVNIPQEVKAHHQEIIDEVLSRLSKFPNTFKWFNTKPFDVALRMTSPLYRDIEMDLSDEHKYETFQTIYQALSENGYTFNRKINPLKEKKMNVRENRKSSVDAEERYKRWHWGIDSTHQLKVDDDRFPDEMIEIGRLMELRLVRPEIDRSNPKYSDNLSIEIDEDSINECYVVFDHNHSKDRIYFLLNPQTQEDFKEIYNDLDDTPIGMNDIAIHGGGHHGDMKDYPDQLVKPFAYITDVVYYTHKKGDDDGIGSGYVHKMGEEGGTEPILGIAEDGTIWMLGGSYTCPYAGITN